MNPPSATYVSSMALLTYEQAARRVRKDVVTIKRWRRNGLRMTTDEHGRRVVEETVLLQWWRDRMASDPIHQARMRKVAIENGWEVPPPPRRPAPTVAVDVDPVDELDDGISPWPSTTVEPMPRLRGEDEYTALLAAMKRSAPACHGDDAFTSDTVAEAEIGRLASICRACPIFAECEAFAAASRPSVGVWAARKAARGGLKMIDADVFT